METVHRPWPALWSLVVGFFMILLDGTIVSVANPTIMRELGAGVTEVLWVTSAYLLAYAVPLLVTGRLGDRYGPKRVYQVGLVVFTASSLWCGLSGDITTLVVARAVQGLGAAMMTPQTMSVITRIFSPDKRGAAMGLWGAVAGVASLLGPLLGGVLVDTLGWEWIFIVNVPVGVVGFLLVARWVPDLSTNPHRFDWLGVALSGTALFLIIFAVQEGQTFQWGTLVGPISIWSLLVTGLVVLVLFLWWQRRNRDEPLLPLDLFADRNFAVSNLAVSLLGMAVVSMPLPILFYFQVGRGLDPTQSALLMSPMAVVTGLSAPLVGKLVDRIHPRPIAMVGFTAVAAGLALMGVLMTPDRPLWLLLLPSVLLGIGMAGLWSPLATSATRNLPPQTAGAGSGVYNTNRQIGSVLGAAGIAALLDNRVAAHLGGGAASPTGDGPLPPEAVAGYATAMAQSLWLPVGAALLGLVVVSFLRPPTVTVQWSVDGARPAG